MLCFEWTFFLFTILASLMQIWALYLCFTMIKFTKKYGKGWSYAFEVFFFTMSITLLRRFMIIGEVLGCWDLPMKLILDWADHILIPLFNSIGWVLFLTLLLRFWRKFFEGFFPNGTLTNMDERDAILTKRENAVTEREGLASKREKEVQKRETT